MDENHSLSDEALDRPASAFPGLSYCNAPESEDFDLSDEALDRPLGAGASVGYSGLGICR